MMCFLPSSAMDQQCTNSPVLIASACAVMMLLIALIISYHISNTRTSKSKKFPPMAPGGLIETINILSSNNCPWWLLQTAKDLDSSIFRMNLYLPRIPMVLQVGDPSIAKEIMIDPLTTRPSTYSVFDSVTMGKASIFTSNGKYWHDRRKGMAPAFSSRHVKRMNAVALKKVDEWIQTTLTKMVEEGQAFDVGKEMIGITMDSIIQTAFEYTMTEDEKILYFHELDLCLKEFMEKSAINPFRQLVGLLIADRRRAFVAGKMVSSLSLKMIQSYHVLETRTKGTIIDCIMNNQSYENNLERAADITTLLIAGHDTTAYSLAWILKELAKNPNEQRRLRDSLRSMDPKEWNHCEHLHKIVKEGIRLFPVSAGGVVRVLGRDFETNEGYLLPKRAMAIFPVMNMSRDPTVFENADCFSPSRWDNPTKAMNDAYMPFALGKQNCIGQSLANEQLHCIVPRIIAEFDLSVKDEGTAEYFMTLKPSKTMLWATKAE